MNDKIWGLLLLMLGGLLLTLFLFKPPTDIFEILQCIFAGIIILKGVIYLRIFARVKLYER
jgi:uncharacterized membrane protein HdeD (DUF308 family)